MRDGFLAKVSFWHLELSEALDEQKNVVEICYYSLQGIYLALGASADVLRSLDLPVVATFLISRALASFVFHTELSCTWLLCFFMSCFACVGWKQLYLLLSCLLFEEPDRESYYTHVEQFSSVTEAFCKQSVTDQIPSALLLKLFIVCLLLLPNEKLYHDLLPLCLLSLLVGVVVFITTELLIRKVEELFHSTKRNGICIPLEETRMTAGSVM